MNRRTTAFLFFALPMAGCSLLGKALRGTGAVADWLIALIADLLRRDDYQTRIDAVAEEQGVAEVAAAVRVVMTTAVKEPTTRTAVMTLAGPQRDYLVADRAELWLRRRGLKP